MSKKIYVFEVIDANGVAVKRLSRRCTNIGAKDRAQKLLHRTPNAAAAFCLSNDGRAVHSAYLH